MKVKATISPILLWILSALTPSAYAAANPQLSEARVVASIKPLHSLVQAVVGEGVEVVLLLDSAASAHDYRMKPSQRQIIRQADFLFYISPGLETFLSGVLRENVPDNQKIALINTEGLKLLKSRSGEEVDLHMAHSGKHLHPVIDPHVWLDPVNVKQIANQIAIVLSDRYPDHADIFQSNVRILRDRLNQLDSFIAGLLSALKEKPYIVFHDAYAYFESRYGLSHTGVILTKAESSPTIRQIKVNRDLVLNSAAVCIFSEPQFSDRIIQTISEGSSVKIGMLDPLGTEIPAGPEHYFQTMKALALNISDCLSGK